MKKLITSIFTIIALLRLTAQSPQLILPIGHTADINDAQFSHDGKRVVTCSNDKIVKIWDAQSGKLLANLKGHSEKISTSKFSPNDKFIVSQSTLGEGILWDANTGKLMANLINDISSFIEYIEFDKEGNLLYVIYTDLKIRVWNTVTAKIIKEYNYPSYSPKTGISDSTYPRVLLHPNGRHFITTGGGTARLWDINTGKPLASTNFKNGLFTKDNEAEYSKDGSKILSFSLGNKIISIFNEAGNSIDSLNIKEQIKSAQFSPNGQLVFCTNNLNQFQVWDLTKRQILYQQEGNTFGLQFNADGSQFILIKENSVELRKSSNGELITSNDYFNPNTACLNVDGTKMLISHPSSKEATIWDLQKNEFVYLRGATYSNITTKISKDGLNILITDDAGIARIWDNKSGQLKNVLKPDNYNVEFITTNVNGEFSNDGKLAVIASDTKTAHVWDVISGNLLANLNGHSGNIVYASFSPDDKKIITASADSSANIYQLNPLTNQWLLYKKIKQNKPLAKAFFSPDGKNIIIINTKYDSISDRDFLVNPTLWDANTAKFKYGLEKKINNIISNVEFSPDSKKVLVEDYETGITLWDISSEKLLPIKTKFPIQNKTNSDSLSFFGTSAFSADGKKIVSYQKTSEYDKKIVITNAITFNEIAVNTEFSDFRFPRNLQFSPDGTRIIIPITSIFGDSTSNDVEIIDSKTGEYLFSLKGHVDEVLNANYSMDGKYIITTSSDNTMKKWTADGKLLYTFLAIVNDNDYLLVDEFNRYDGSEHARDLLYFTCGTEIIELNQLKTLSWEPGLVEKLNGSIKEPITAKKINDIDICNVTPIVVQKGFNNGWYNFEITERRGGIGQIQLYINGKMIKDDYILSSLPKKGNAYQLALSDNDGEIKSRFEPGKSNIIKVKATTKDGNLSSQEATIATGVIDKSTANINVYIVSIGISDYKGEALKLNYAAKDAESFAATMQQSAKKLFNISNEDHVFNYIFTTSKNNPNKPTKAAIVKQLNDIAKVAKANDILVIFFAGHGEMISGSKEFYLLTQEAASFELELVEKEVSINTQELNEWMRQIKANKQLLILDACKSGQAVENLQDLVVKRGGSADQLRALENLKDKTGTFILSAASSGQLANESGKFGQGLLTYSLLDGIKTGEGLKDDQIDVTRWFNTAGDKVRIMAKSIGEQQDPKIIGSASFPVGLVDDEIKKNIQLSDAKKIIGRSIFYTGDPTLLIDDLNISNSLDKAIANSTADNQAPFIFLENYKLSDAYHIRGVYSIKNGLLTIEASLINLNKRTGNKATKIGRLEEQDQLFQQIITELGQLMK